MALLGLLPSTSDAGSSTPASSNLNVPNTPSTPSSTLSYVSSQNLPNSFQVYDPESSKVLNLNQYVFDTENNWRQDEINFDNKYLGWDTSTQNLWNSTYPNYWKEQGGVPPGQPGHITRQLLQKIPPSTPVTINTTTGAGVPGGFDGASLKHPTDEVNNTTSAISSVAASQAQLVSAASSPCVLSGKITIPNLIPAIGTLNVQLNALKVKLQVALKAPNFSNPFVLPQPPRLPKLPTLKLPTIPSDPCIQSPSLPAGVSVPSVPSINSSNPSVTSLPTSLSVPSISTT